MAVFKWIGAIHPEMNGGSRFSHVKRLLHYIANPLKTDNGVYVGSNLCFSDPDDALRQIMQTDALYGKLPSKGNDRIAYHACISFKKNDENVNKDKAFDIVTKFVNEYLSDYECLYSVHSDKEHIHCHIAFNSVNSIDGRKFQYSDNDWEKLIMPIIDRLCREHGINTLEEDTMITYSEMKADRKNKRYKDFKNNKRKSNNKYYKEENDKFASRKDMIRYDIDRAINESGNYNGFLNALSDMGYVYRTGKTNNPKYSDSEYLALKCSGMNKFRRTYALGRDYTVDAIKDRITNKKKEIFKDEDFVPYSNPDLAYIFYKRKLYGFKVHYDFVKMNRVQGDYFKEQYKILYNLGIIPKYQKVNHKEANERVKEIKRIIGRLDMVSDNNFTSVKEVENVLNDKLVKASELDEKSRKINNEIRKYKKIKKNFEKLSKLEIENELFLKGNKDYEESSILFEKLKAFLVSSNVTFEDTTKMLDSLYSQRKALSMEKKSLNRDIEELNILKGEFDEVRLRNNHDIDNDILYDIDSSYSFDGFDVRRHK